MKQGDCAAAARGQGAETQDRGGRCCPMPKPSGSFALALSCAALAGCVTTTAMPRPEFAQRAPPRAGQDEIELLAGITGTLAIQDGCLGVLVGGLEEPLFTTVVWPWNAELERDGSNWRVRNVQTQQTIGLGEELEGSGGYASPSDRESLSRYNRFLKHDLSTVCAAKGTFSLNRGFGPGTRSAP